MKKQEVMDALTELRANAAATKKAVQELEQFVAKANEDFAAKKEELKSLTKALQDAVREDAKAAVKLLKAEARARLLGLLGE